MASFRSASILTIFLLLAGWSASADVGTRQLLLHEREVLLGRVERIKGDTSVAAQRKTDSLRAAVIDLDGRIFASYDETLTRVAAQQRRRGTNNQYLTIFSLICCLLALSSTLALWLANERIQRATGSGLLSLLHSLFLDMILKVNPDQAESATASRVSPVVILGVVGMAVSIVVYLVSRLL